MKGEQIRLRDLPVRTLIPLWIALALFMARAIYSLADFHGLGVDAHAYWLTAHRPELYTGRPMMQDAYLYSPAFAQLIWPLTQLPWHAFFAVWVIAEAAAFAWLLAPLGWSWGVPAFLLCGFEIAQGNINALLAVVVVLGFRYPAAWALPLLTKIVIGLGPVWFAARREWRSLAVAVGATFGIAAVSAAISPHLWPRWVHFLASASEDPSVAPRVLAAILVTIYAARRDRPWLLAPAIVLASPVLHGIGQYLTICAAIPRLRRPQRPSNRDEVASQLVDATP